MGAVIEKRKGKTASGRDYDVALYRPSVKFLPAEAVNAKRLTQKKKKGLWSAIAEKFKR